MCIQYTVCPIKYAVHSAFVLRDHFTTYMATLKMICYYYLTFLTDLTFLLVSEIYNHWTEAALKDILWGWRQNVTLALAVIYIYIYIYTHTYIHSPAMQSCLGHPFGQQRSCNVTLPALHHCLWAFRMLYIFKGFQNVEGKIKFGTNLAFLKRLILNSILKRQTLW